MQSRWFRIYLFPYASSQVHKIKYEINSKLIKTHQNIMQFAAAAEATNAEGIMQQLQL